MGKPVFIARQASHPRGLLGWIVAQIMSRETGWENKKSTDLMNMSHGQSALDIGCGHGATLKYMSKRVKSGRVVGVDPSSVMIDVATKKNRSATIEIVQAEASNMPFSDGTFDAAMSVHTIYFWAEPVEELSEIRRVVTDNGRFVMCFRSTDDPRFIADSPDAAYNIRSQQEVEALLEKAGWRVEDKIDDQARGALFHWYVCRPNRDD